MEPNVPLLDAVRDLAREAALSELDEEETARVLDLLDEVRTRLEPVRQNVMRRPFEAPSQARRRDGGHWLAGEFNPVVPLLPLQLLENEVTCTWTAGALDEGPPGFLHGGLSAYILDVLSGVLVQSLGIRAVTGTLNLRYLRAIPLKEELHMGAHLNRVDGRKLYVSGHISVRGEKAVESEGLFIELLPDSHLTASMLKSMESKT